MAPFSASVEPGQFHAPSHSSESHRLPSSAVDDAPADTYAPVIPAAGVRRKRVQQYLRRIKRLVRERWPSDVRKPTKIGTVEALERAVELIRQSRSTGLPSTSTTSENTPAGNDDMRKPLSPWGAGSAGSPDAGQGAASPQSAATADGPTSAAASDAAGNYRALDAGCGGLQESSAKEADLRRHIGSVVVKLPEGIILELSPPAATTTESCGKLDDVLQVGENLLEKLHGKGAQTLLLNAFCGHSKRRMYARLKVLDTIRAYEFLCEFRVDDQNPATRVARVDVLSVDTSLHSAVLNSSRAVFVTRHNASCAVIYLDSASIPFLGHFPSEITGKSLFSLVSAEDAAVVKQAHRQLHANQIVSTPGLRLVSYNGDVVLVDSEWSAFINPWTNQIEMVVGRHTVVPRTQQTETENACSAAMTQLEGDAAQLHQNLGAFIEEVVEDLVANGGQSSTPQSVHKYEPVSPSPARAVSDRGTPVSADGSGSLSYNQINCLENVHRLLKSQNHAQELPSPPLAAAITAVPSGAAPLTRELLQQHDRRWEADCKDTWKKRLTQKRRSDEREGAAAATTVKMARRCAELRQEGGSKGNSVRTETASPSNANYQITSVPIPLTSTNAYAVEPVNLSTTGRKKSATSVPTTTQPILWNDYIGAVQRVMQRGGVPSGPIDGGENVSATMQLLQLAQRAQLEQRHQQLYAAALAALQGNNATSGAPATTTPTVDPTSFLSMFSTFHS
ncbi:Protein LIN-42 b [Aphelenchoides avenae]|nr:Protein LIN-42 b [Aphelenchus avenae]